MTTVPELDQFPSRISEKLSYRDTDPLGHVNHVVFVSMLETGRIAVFFENDKSLLSKGCGLVVVSLSVNFLAEARWPGQVEIGTRITKIGRSSVTVEQGIFQNGRCCTTGITVIAQMNMTTRRSQALEESTVDYLESLMANSN